MRGRRWASRRCTSLVSRTPTSQVHRGAARASQATPAAGSTPSRESRREMTFDTPSSPIETP